MIDRAEIHRITDQPNAETTDAGDESGLTKLHREAEVLLGGTMQGIATGVEEARNDPWNTGLKLAGSVAVGVGLAYLQRGAGAGRLAGEVLGLGMGTAFMTDVASPARLDTIGNAMSDTWNTSKHTDKNKAVIGQNLGQFAFDTALMMTGGMVGSMWGKSAFGSKLTLTESGTSTRSLDLQVAEIRRQGIIGPRSASELLAGSAHMDRRVTELPGTSRPSLLSESELIVQATDPEVPSTRFGAHSEPAPVLSAEPARRVESTSPGLDTKTQTPPADARPLIPEVRNTGADPAAMTDIPARDVLARWDVRDVGNAELLARRKVTKRTDGRIVGTTSAYGEVTEFEYGVRGLHEVLTGVKFPDGTVARLIRDDRWFVSTPGKPMAEWEGRMSIQPDGSLIKLPASGGSETIFLNGLREITSTDGDRTHLVQDLRGRTLKVQIGFSPTVTGYEYDGGTSPVRAFELSNGVISQVA